ncbi:MAG: hypothetical protein ABIJ31_08325 [Pseudomonadota bacterium]
MKIRFLFSFFVLFCILQPCTGRAFVPQTPHLLHLVVQKIKQPVGLYVFQTKTIVDCDAIQEEGVSLQEALLYQYPNQLRSEVKSNPAATLSVESGFKFIKVINGETVSKEKSFIDLYTDILLYRDHESLIGQLALEGIDVTKVTFQRYDNTICYVIGQPRGKGQPFAGLWIEKETFLPVRYVVEKKDWMVECLYSNWQLVSRTWYPMQITIFLDSQLFATINVNHIDLKSDFSPGIFDISRIERLYPEKLEPGFLDENSKEKDELNKRIEEFKKLYE